MTHAQVSPLRMLVAGLLALACGAASGHLAAAQPGDAAQPRDTEGLDARHVETQVPAKVITDEVFEASVTIKNTGSQSWGDGMKLRCWEPLDAMTWGTNYIYLGQGRGCGPGEEITLRSCLKAPDTPGEYVFQWRMAQNQDGHAFGEPTAHRTIVVEPGPAEAPAKPPVRDRSDKRVLTIDDFEYVGSLKVPDQVEGCGAAFTESGLALRTAADGTKSLFVRTGLHRSVLYEATIPEPVKLDGHDHAPLKVAEIKRVWGEIKLPGEGENAIRANAGFWWDDAKSILYWSYYHGYCTGRPPVLGASRLEEGKGLVHYGPWSVPQSIPWFKSYWGGVTRLPDSFARQYTGGRRLVLGFGGYYSICASASRGPALAAISDPDPRKSTLDMVELLTYPWPKNVAAPRDGDYFVANCSWGGQAPESPAKGSWTMDDWARAGVLIDLPDKHGLLVLAFLGTGRIGYDYGAIRSAGHACCWYFYDPKDLGEVARGDRKPWEVVPHSLAAVDYPRGIREGSPWGSTPGDPTGCCFDAPTRRLYVYQRFCIDNGARELFPCVHVYRVK
ncbi:MAG: hypothetical protein JXB62_20555 [Pirellulales bacterium]|nr:hypothetical protein [Pirellulales bacterium]